MARRVFFSFHYQDAKNFRVNVVRNHWVTKPDRESAGFFDASIWEDAERTSDITLKRLINKELENTSVTAILIGSDTYERRWVRYEVMKSLSKGNKIIGIHINGIKDKDEKVETLGRNPFEYLAFGYSADGRKLFLEEWKVGNWVTYGDLGGWELMHQAKPELWGKSWQLSSFYQVYDWVADDGYTNFADWVG